MEEVVIGATLERLARELGERLRARGSRVATAESCTGGLVAGAITAVPGSSEWFECGFVAYSNAAKSRLLGVPDATLGEYGAVSEASALAMAQGALERSAADLAVAVTGVAGPGGGTPSKPVGTVCFAWAARGGERSATTHRFDGDRAGVRLRSVETALKGLIERLPRAPGSGAT